MALSKITKAWVDGEAERVRVMTEHNPSKECENCVALTAERDALRMALQEAVILIGYTNGARTETYERLKAILKSATVTRESSKEILEWVSKDKLRILDPDFHRGGAIAGEKATEEEKQLLQGVISRFHEAHK